MSERIKYKVNLTQNAYRNLQSIIEFYADFPQAATDFLNDFQSKIELISANPCMYPIPMNLPNFAILEYRKAVLYKRHAILYVVDNENKMVYIMYAVDTRQNTLLTDPVTINSENNHSMF